LTSIMIRGKPAESVCSPACLALSPWNILRRTNIETRPDFPLLPGSINSYPLERFVTFPGPLPGLRTLGLAFPFLSTTRSLEGHETFGNHLFQVTLVRGARDSFAEMLVPFAVEPPFLERQGITYISQKS
jgi:hypothetical protein